MTSTLNPPLLSQGGITRARILIVEDEGLLASHLASTLNNLGYQVVGISGSSEDALDKITNLLPELIIMDIKIRGEMDGIETATAVRDQFDIPLIYLIGHPDEETLDRAKMTGASSFLPKRFHRMTLAASIETAIHKHRADQSRKEMLELQRTTEERVQALLKKTEEQYFQLVVEASPSAMIMVDADGLITLANAKTEKLFGYGHQDLLGRSLETLLPERLRAEYGGHKHGFFAASSTRVMGAGRDLFGLRIDGSEVPVEIGLNPIIASNGRFVLASITDISERKKTDECFQLAVDAVPNAMIMVQGDGLITLVNTQAEKLFGYKRNELLGQHMEMLVPERFRANHVVHRNGFLVAPSVRVIGADQNLFGLCKDGGEVPIEIGLNPIDTKHGKFVLASIIDVTERNRTNKEREDLISQLERSLAEKTTLLNEVHHRVKNNLAVVVALLGMQADALDDKRLTRPLENSQQRVASMALVHEYLYATEHLDRVNFREYIQSLSSELRLSYAVSDEISFVFEIAEIALPVHRAIPCGLILNELLSNALQYGFPNNRPGKITVRLERLETDELSLSCTDDGVGIPEGLDWQNAKSLGLRIIHILANQLNGKFTLHRLMSGTQFELRF